MCNRVHTLLHVYGSSSKLLALVRSSLAERDVQVRHQCFPKSLSYL